MPSTISNVEIEKIEKYYLDVISRYIGADIHGLIHLLEGHNKSWSEWYPHIKKTSSTFARGAERVIYMLLSRGDILGIPNSNPIGSDSSFIKYDPYFKRHLSINIDVKTTIANNNLSDVIGNSPIGINQNSYDSNIFVKQGSSTDIRHYSPNLKPVVKIKNNQGEKIKHIVLSYSIIILVEQLPLGQTPKNDNVVMINIGCIPNGELYSQYGDHVFNAGKTSNLKIYPGQRIILPNSSIYITKGGETMRGITSKNIISIDEYVRLNKNCKHIWDMEARFKNDLKFELLDEKPWRLNKIFLKEKRLDDLFFHIKNNKYHKKAINRRNKTIKEKDFLIHLPLF